MTIDLESELRSVLSRKADSLDARPRQYDPYPGTERRVRRDRTRRRLIATAVTAVVIAAIAAPVSTAALRADGGTAATSVADWPTRGSLAGDLVFVTALRGQAGGGQVLYAGDDGVHRVGLVYLTTKSMAMASVFFGPTGEPAAKLEKSEVSSFPASQDQGPGAAMPIVWATEPEKSVETPRTLLVVGDPRMRNLRLSPTVIVGPGPSMHRVGRPIASRDGTVFAEVSGMRRPQLKATLGHRTFHLPGAVTSGVIASGNDLSDPSAAGRDVPNLDDADLSELVGAAANGLGVAPSTITVKTRWRGKVDAIRTLVALLTVPGFPTFQVVMATRQHPDGSSVTRFLIGMDTASVGWPVTDPAASDTRKAHADGAVLVPGQPGRRVYLLLNGKALAAADTDGNGLATFRLTGLTAPQLAKARYEVVDDGNRVTARGTMNADTYGSRFDVEKW